MSAGRRLYDHLIQVQIGDVIKQSCGCNQFATHNDDKTRNILTLTPKQFRALLVMRSTAGVPKQPDVQGEILRREAAKRQHAHDERR